MRNQFIRKAALTLAAMALAGTAFAQAQQGGGGQGRGPDGAGAPGAGTQGAGAPVGAAPGGAAPAGPGGGRGGRGAALASPNPVYMSIRLEVDVNKSAADVWARVGKYCDIGEWLGAGACTMLSGKEGDLGSVRSIGNEIMVAKTDLSYSYTQPPRVGQFYDLYHGTVEAKPVTATTSKLVYSLLWDASNLADDAAREANKTQRTGTFQNALNNMKILAEGGTLPARGGGGGGRGAGGGGRGAGGGAPRGPGAQPGGNN